MEAFVTIALGCAVCMVQGVAQTQAWGQRPTFEEAVLGISGVADLSELDEDEMLRYRDLAASPIGLNSCTRSELSGSGLLSEYQVETVLDWRTRNGDILSVDELAAVDGFGAGLAGMLSVFLSFDPAWNRTKDTLIMKYKVTGGTGLKVDKGKGRLRWCAKADVKASAAFGDFEASGALRPEWSFPLEKPEEAGWNVSYSGSSWLGYASVGCFNARFGQGLLNWSGVNIESFSSPASLMKKGNGIRAYRSWTPSEGRCGLAARADIGQFSISPFWDWMHGEVGGNAAWKHRNGQLGLNLLGSGKKLGASLDFQQSMQGVVVYGEVEAVGNTAGEEGGAEAEASALTGALWTMDRADLASRVGWSEYEHNFTLSSSCTSSDRKHSFNGGISVSYFPKAKGHTPKGAGQLKAQAVYKGAEGEKWSFATKADVKLRTLTRFSAPDEPFAAAWSMARYSLRQDVKWSDGLWSACLRADGVYGKGPAALLCAEGGRSGGRLGFDIQGGLFLVDNWDDRIYVYVKDMPTSYSSTAMYGRGWWVSGFVKVLIGRYLRLYFKMTWTSWPWAREGDAHTGDSIEAKMQLDFTL